MGVTASLFAQSLPAKSKFSVDDIPDLSGRVIIVTGGKTGIGKETVRALLTHNAKVYLAARGKDETEKVIAELKKLTGKEAIFLDLDLSSLARVRASAEEFLSKEKELHILFNNAGVMWPPMDQLSEEGYDLQFGVHVVGTHLFTKLLMPALLAGAHTSPDRKARVITTSSSGAYLDTLHWDTLVDGPARRARTIVQLYSQSKFAQVVWARELAKRYGDQGILSLSLNPGNIQTELQRHTSPWMRRFINAFLYPVVPYGPLTQLYGATSPDVLEKNGAFLIPWAKEGAPPAEAKDPAQQERLWEYLEKAVVTK